MPKRDPWFFRAKGPIHFVWPANWKGFAWLLAGGAAMFGAGALLGPIGFFGSFLVLIYVGALNTEDHPSHW